VCGREISVPQRREHGNPRECRQHRGCGICYSEPRNITLVPVYKEQGLEFRIMTVDFGVQGSEFRVWGLGVVACSGCKV